MKNIIATGPSYADHIGVTAAQRAAFVAVLAADAYGSATSDACAFRARVGKRTSTQRPWNVTVQAVAANALEQRGLARVLVPERYDTYVAASRVALTDKGRRAIEHTAGLRADVAAVVAEMRAISERDREERDALALAHAVGKVTP